MHLSLLSIDFENLSEIQSTVILNGAELFKNHAGLTQQCTKRYQAAETIFVLTMCALATQTHVRPCDPTSASPNRCFKLFVHSAQT